jgi:ribonuclease HI
MINTDLPHCLLFVDTIDDTDSHNPWPRWSFRLQIAGEGETVSASDCESGVAGERLLLFGLVRGLEAIEQPSRVSVISPSRSLRRGLEHGIDAWRAAGWRWERFGRLVTVRNADLWQRVAQAVKYHQVAVKLWRIETAHEVPTRPHYLRRRIRLQNAVRGNRLQAV